ncbi:GDSL ESTERASE/LIPASE 7-LIKE [Salix purpurea]|uniref:GDSL ESTERASE/LIPASE 7-LIKE n=1 Tax=Salix purpurea TaxID=77065 RepID=A0A9Q0Z2C6_SALPP|nr:GDSL ESTERASE/LIPASE 7-LIKE [Salix purpurea]
MKGVRLGIFGVLIVALFAAPGAIIFVLMQRSSPSVKMLKAISKATPHEGDCAESINQALLSHNKELFMKLSKLQSQLHGSFFVHTDTFKFFQELKENKEKFGITDTQNACWEGRHDPCPERDRYIYFDSAHPSQVTTSIFATGCLNESSICTPMNMMQLVSAGGDQ